MRTSLAIKPKRGKDCRQQSVEGFFFFGVFFFFVAMVEQVMSKLEGTEWGPVGTCSHGTRFESFTVPALGICRGGFSKVVN